MGKDSLRQFRNGILLYPVYHLIIVDGILLLQLHTDVEHLPGEDGVRGSKQVFRLIIHRNRRVGLLDQFLDVFFDLQNVRSSALLTDFLSTPAGRSLLNTPNLGGPERSDNLLR